MKKRNVIITVLLSVGVMLVIGYTVYAYLNFNRPMHEMKCRHLDVHISGKVPLLAQQDVHELLNSADLHPIGMPLDQVRAERIERMLSEHPFVHKVKCYYTPTGRTVLELRLRTPKFIVAGRENYYIDEEKYKMPVPVHSVAYVPLITGRVTLSMATGVLFDFVSYLQQDPFWNAQIAQIHVREDLNIELVPRVGEAVILLGSLENYADKLERMYKLYTQAFNVIGWNRYAYLDLRFNDRIIAHQKQDMKMN